MSGGNHVIAAIGRIVMRASIHWRRQDVIERRTRADGHERLVIFPQRDAFPTIDEASIFGNFSS
jgi:hypothetical protein